MRCRENIIAWTPVFVGATALVILCLSISSDYWLITTERNLVIEFLQGKCHNEVDTEGFGNISMDVKVRFGLWRFCTVYDATDPQCIYLDYTSGLINSKEDCQETSAAIAEAQKGSAPAFLLSLILILVAVILNIVGNSLSSALVQAAGILYLSSGLCLLTGVVLYITFVDDEVHFAKPTTEVYFFEYSYGWGIYILSIAFVNTHGASVMCVIGTKNYYLANTTLHEKLADVLEQSVPETVPKSSYDTLIM